MDSQKEHRQYTLSVFKKWALFYDKMAWPVAPIRKYVARHTGLKSGSRILDVACGTGSQTVAFAKNGFLVVGLDLCSDMLERAWRKLRADMHVKLLCHDATQIPFEKDSFGLSSISFALHDMPEDIALDVLREMKRVTKSGAKIIIIDYHLPSFFLFRFSAYWIPKIWETKYYDHFRKFGLEPYLERVGLKIQKKETFYLGNVQVVTCLNT